jgi:hypothetical protein
MENQDKIVKGKKYDVDELVKIGDHIHNSSSSFIMCINDLDDIDKEKSIFFSSHGGKEDIVLMFAQVIEKNPKMEVMLLEALATYNILHEIKNKK